MNATGIRAIFNKLRNTKDRFRQWNRDSFGKIFQKVRDAEVLLHQRELAYDVARDEISRASLGEARVIHAHALAVECDYWRQKSAIKWIQSGDANTKFFHSMVRQKRSTNSISRIKDVVGH